MTYSPTAHWFRASCLQIPQMDALITQQLFKNPSICFFRTALLVSCLAFDLSSRDNTIVQTLNVTVIPETLTETLPPAGRIAVSAWFFTLYLRGAKMHSLVNFEHGFTKDL